MALAEPLAYSADFAVPVSVAQAEALGVAAATLLLTVAVRATKAEAEERATVPEFSAKEDWAVDNN